MRGKGKTQSPRQLTSRELSDFCSQMALLFQAGITAGDGIDALLEDSGEGSDRKLLEQLKGTLEEGEQFSEAVARSGRFPAYSVQMMRIGEQAGRLDEVMSALTLYYDRSDALSRSIRSAVGYPAVMVLMMAAVISVLLVKVLPIFDQVFRQLGGELSPFTRSMMEFGGALSRNAGWILGGAAVIVLGIFLLSRTPAAKQRFSSFLHSFPLTRGLYQKVEAQRFASAMSMMLSSGLDLDESLEMTEKLMTGEKTRRRIGQMRREMSDGMPFAQAVGEAGLFSGVYATMLAVGFRTGRSEDVMTRVADRYQEEIDQSLGTLVSMLEPTLVAVLSVIVGMILLSVMLPLMGIMSSIG